MRLATTCAAVLALASALAAPASAEDPVPPGKAPPPPVKKAPEPAEVAGIRWEREFEAGLRRATREGRPVFLAVNANEQEGATTMLASQAYPSRPWGEASRLFVCLVANTYDHGEKTLADGTKVCGRFGVGTCQAHKEAWTFAVRRFSDDGESLISPSHFVLEPDGGVAWNKSYYTGEETPPFLDAWAVRLAPRLAMRRVWTSRDDRMTALSEAPTERLGRDAATWIADPDPMSVAGVAAVLDQETDPARRAALLGPLSKGGPAAVPVVFDATDASTGNPDADVEEAFRWTDLALSLEPGFGAWAACRVLARSKDENLRARVLVRLTNAPPGTTPDPKTLPGPLLARVAEARALAGEKGAAEALEQGDRSAIGETRAARALARAGLVPAVSAALGDAAASRDARRSALLLATPEVVKESLADVRRALGDPAYEVRVAAAIALRRVGDASGATLLLAALGDPVEGPEAREALVAWKGEDLGEDPAAWEEALRATDGGGK